MPIYVYQCKDGHQFDVYKSIKNIDRKEVCKCGKSADRKIVPTMINCDMQTWNRYVSPTTGKLITSYRERREDMARSNCVEYDPGMKRDYDNGVKRADEKLEKSIDQTVEREWEKMPSSKKERLANELSSGVDIEVTRI